MEQEYVEVPIAEAVQRASLPAGATAYTLRHSTVTDLVIGGLLLLTIGQISDTSAEMIERPLWAFDPASCDRGASEIIALGFCCSFGRDPASFDVKIDELTSTPAPAWWHDLASVT